MTKSRLEAMTQGVKSLLQQCSSLHTALATATFLPPLAAKRAGRKARFGDSIGEEDRGQRKWSMNPVLRRRGGRALRYLTDFAFPLGASVRTHVREHARACGYVHANGSFNRATSFLGSREKTW